MINYRTKISLKNAISLSKYSEKVKLSNSVLKWNKEDFFEFGDKVTKGVIEQFKNKICSRLGRGGNYSFVWKFVSKWCRSGCCK